MIRVENLMKRFGGVVAANNISFEVKKGEVLGIIGPNGSGKTTVVNLITGFIKPDSGRVFFAGKDITAKPPHEIASLGVVRTFQNVRPFYNLPAYKNLVIPLYSPRAKSFEEFRHGDRDHIALDLLEEVGFERDSPIPYKPASALPHGYIKRLELARALALKPEVLICDELFSGLSQAEIASLLPILEKLNENGLTLIMVEHRLKELFELADKVVVLEYGEKIAEGKPEEIVEDEKVKEAFLGAEVI